MSKRRLQISKFRAGGLEGRLGSSPQAKIMTDLTKKRAGFAEKEAPEIIIKEKISRKHKKTKKNAETTKKNCADRNHPKRNPSEGKLSKFRTCEFEVKLRTSMKQNFKISCRRFGREAGKLPAG